MEFILTNHFGLELLFTARQASMKQTKSSSLLRRCRATMERRFVVKKPQEPLFEVSSILLEDLSSLAQQTPPIWLQEHRKNNKSFHSQDSDELTLETVNSYYEDEETSVSCSSSCNNINNNSVSFAEPLVTEIWYRPILTTLEEKLELFYTDADYKAFRADFFEQRRLALFRKQQQQQQRVRKVKFPRTVVSATHVYATDSSVDKDALFYSEADLQRFLDEFVSSLNGASLMPQSS